MSGAEGDGQRRYSATHQLTWPAVTDPTFVSRSNDFKTAKPIVPTLRMKVSYYFFFLYFFLILAAMVELQLDHHLVNSKPRPLPCAAAM